MNKEEESDIIIPILKKYVGIKMYKDLQEKFKKEFFGTLYEPYDTPDYSKRTTLIINEILEEDNVQYYFHNCIDEKDIDNNWWWIEDLTKIK
jgi:hypothetical protein